MSSKFIVMVSCATDSEGLEEDPNADVQRQTALTESELFNDCLYSNKKLKHKVQKRKLKTIILQEHKSLNKQ